MKILLISCALYMVTPLSAQTTTASALRSRCLPEAPQSTLEAIVHVESGDNPNAMQIDFPRALSKKWKLSPGTLRLQRQPRNRDEALAWLRYFDRLQIFVDLGLMQVSTAEAQRRGIPADSLLDSCTNIRVGWQILKDAYKIEVKFYGPGEIALTHALSRYNTGSTQAGFDNGYVPRVLAALRKIGSEQDFQSGK